jgi:hypothetical protein
MSGEAEVSVKATPPRQGDHNTALAHRQAFVLSSAQGEANGLN